MPKTQKCARRTRYHFENIPLNAKKQITKKEEEEVNTMIKCTNND